MIKDFIIRIDDEPVKVHKIIEKILKKAAEEHKLEYYTNEITAPKTGFVSLSLIPKDVKDQFFEGRRAINAAN